MAGPDPERARAAEAALAPVAAEWAARPGVVAVEVARRWRDGAPTDEVGIRVTVARKRPLADLPAGEAFPEALGDVPVDIVEGRPPGPEG